MNLFIDNIGTITVSALLIAVIILIIYRIKKDKAAGKSSCGGNCAGCALHGKCHK